MCEEKKINRKELQILKTGAVVIDGNLTLRKMTKTKLKI